VIVLWEFGSYTTLILRSTMLKSSPSSRQSDLPRLSRREFFGTTILGGTVGACASRGSAAPSRLPNAEAAIAARQALSDNIYTRMLGLKPHLAAMDHITALGGSRMPAEVMQAMHEANEQFVDMHELMRAAGARLAEVLGADAALVTSGSFSAMILGAAACLTGNDEAKIDALPHPTWSKRECLTQTSGRFGYDRAYRAAGMTMVNVETREQFADAITSNTAMISGLARLDYETADQPESMQVHELLEFGRRAGVPVIVDAASELPPTTTLTRWVDAGADLVVISGGKGIRGPQSTGILAGRRDLIEAATLHAAPNANLGRGMKVGKEEIMGFLVALDRYVKLDHDRVYAAWRRKAEYIANELQGIPGLVADVPQDDRGRPRVDLTWDGNSVSLSSAEVREGLKNGDPRIAMTGQAIQTRCMNDGEEILVAQRVQQFFRDEAQRLS
jgi:L-seryl-tRNA(Ser) seleniumtransferase|tara:strand:- start:15961 stop:17298 length:1338 start_codon:yes stop_codon:yes gene_type:complete